MTAHCEARGGRQRIHFGILAQQVLALDSAVEWVALEEAGREPRWAWRDPKSGEVCARSATGNAQIADPLLLTVAECGEGQYGEETVCNPHHLLFLVLAYADMLQIVARMGTGAHLCVAVTPKTDPYVLGTKLMGLLDRCARPPALS
jgi:hypothetical protein